MKVQMAVRTAKIAALVSASALAFAACSTPADDAPAPGTDVETDSGSDEDAGADEGKDDASSSGDFTVAFVTPESTGEYYGAMYCGAQAAADEHGINLLLQGTPEVTVEAQMQVLQSVLATEPDGLITAVWDAEAYNNILGEYTSAGNPLIMPDSFITSGEYVQSIRTDSYQSSYDAAVQVVANAGLTEGKVLIVTDSPGNAIQSARAEGFRDAIEKETGLEALEFQYVGGDSADASATVTSAAAANSDLAIVFSTNIGAGTGSANGILTSGLDITHVGYDASSGQVEQLRNGEYDVLIAQSPYQMGYETVALMAEILSGQMSVDDVTEQTVYSDWAMLTADNVDDSENAPFLYTTDCSAV